MKLKISMILLVIIACLPAIASADTPTSTETSTATVTPTITGTPPTATYSPTATGTFTVTPTITPSSTITQTWTASPTPQASVFAYPNPAAYRDTMFIAYPSKTNNAADIKRVIITIYGANGDYVSRIIDDTPNGYTEFNITKLARGMYIYKVLVRYLDGTEDKYTYKKFAIIK